MWSPREAKAVFRQMRIKKARISKKSKSLTLMVELPHRVSQEDISSFCALIQEQLPAFRDVFLDVMVWEEKNALAQIVERDKDVLLETLEEKVTGVKNWLYMAKWQCCDFFTPDGSCREVLLLTFPHPFAVEICEEKSYPRFLPV